MMLTREFGIATGQSVEKGQKLPRQSPTATGN
jgi:hypothetical protein